jgi:hypothetical protein
VAAHRFFPLNSLNSYDLPEASPSFSSGATEFPKPPKTDTGLLEIHDRPIFSLATREDRSPIAGEKHYAGFQLG